MADYSLKSVQDLAIGDLVFDGHLNTVEVLAIGKNYLDERKMYQFGSDGPVFTADHQFYSNIDNGQVGVFSKTALFRENPQLKEPQPQLGVSDTN